MPVVCKLSQTSLGELVEIERHSNRPPWNQALFAREFDNKFSTVFGIRAQGALAGFLVCHVILEEAHIVNFGIAPQLRNQGLGRQLLSEVLSELHRQAVRVVTLEVRKSNLAALGLYASCGFLECGIREQYYSDDKEDGLLMRLDPLIVPQQMPLPGSTRAANDSV